MGRPAVCPRGVAGTGHRPAAVRLEASGRHAALSPRFVWIARKNGKTELAAGIALLILVGDAEMGGQVFSIASEEAQAKIVFTKASNMAVRTPVLAQKLECLGKVIYCPRVERVVPAAIWQAQGQAWLSTCRASWVTRSTNGRQAISTPSCTTAPLRVVSRWSS
jgi:hypothetical protein